MLELDGVTIQFGGLTALKDRARELARADAAEVVQRFGELGKRKFHFAA